MAMLSRRKWVAVLVVVLLAAAVAATLAMLPRRYLVSEQLSGVTVFWHEDEAFVFVGHNGMGRSASWLTDRLPQAGPAGLLLFMLGEWRAFGHSTTAYRAPGVGTLERYDIPNSVIWPTWELRDGRLAASARFDHEQGEGYVWNGSGFTRSRAAAPSPPPRGRARTLSSDDEEDADVARSAAQPIPPAARDALKAAGWHFKHLTGYEALKEPAELPITLRTASYTLRLRSEPRADSMLPIATSVELAGPSPGAASRILLPAGAWTEIDREAFDRRQTAAAGAGTSPAHFPVWTALLFLLLSLGFLVLRLGGVVGGLWSFFGLFGLKKRLVRGVATTISYPPAIPEQFPALDRERLEQWSRELEGLGFERLGDFSPVSDSPNAPATFARLFTHSRNACYGVITQFFQRGKPALELRCLFNSNLEQGWAVGATSGQPIAASSLVRRPRAIGVTVPEAGPGDLLSSFLQLREQVCQDLGLRPLTDCTLAAYVRRSQESLAEIREAVQKKNLAVGLSEVYYRKLALFVRAQPKHVWLGDYPRVAEERRKAGLGPGFGSGIPG